MSICITHTQTRRYTSMHDRTRTWRWLNLGNRICLIEDRGDDHRTDRKEKLSLYQFFLIRNILGEPKLLRDNSQGFLRFLHSRRFWTEKFLFRYISRVHLWCYVGVMCRSFRYVQWYLPISSSLLFLSCLSERGGLYGTNRVKYNATYFFHICM